jgi:hypothetical protein
MPDTSFSRKYVMPPGSITFPTAPPIPPMIEVESTYDLAHMCTAPNNLSSDKATVKKGELHAVCGCTLADRKMNQFN